MRSPLGEPEHQCSFSSGQQPPNFRKLNSLECKEKAYTTEGGVVPQGNKSFTAPTPHTTTPVQQGHSMCPNLSEGRTQFDWALTERPVQSEHQPLQNQGPSYQVNRPKSLTRDDYFLVEVLDEVCWSCFMITQTLRDVLTSGSHYSQQSKGSRMLPTPRGGVQWYTSMTVSCTV
jgi:hypothetical protein